MNWIPILRDPHLEAIVTNGYITVQLKEIFTHIHPTSIYDLLLVILAFVHSSHLRFLGL